MDLTHIIAGGVFVAFIVAAVGFARRRRNKNAKPGSGGRPGTGSPDQQQK